MTKYINVFEAIQKANDEPVFIDDVGGVGDVKMFLMSCTPCDVEPVRHGTWRKISMETIMGEKTIYSHDECGRWSVQGAPYCPKCGAKMDGGV